ncbi:hypothetical protein, partial [Burkholderia sp. IMCC1007]|uniref:hypothetical protein n=1 Tax=Burkholderia sp. IMCC1007 TaxID=3004104 RepID=UPI0022B4715F
MPVSPRRSIAAVADSADPFDAEDAALPARSAGERGSAERAEPRSAAPRRAAPKRGADGRLAQPAA